MTVWLTIVGIGEDGLDGLGANARNAIDQAELVAENIMGADKEYVAKPWFWSDQYDLKLQIAGLNTGYDEVVLSGDPADPRTSVEQVYLEGERVYDTAQNRRRW